MVVKYGPIDAHLWGPLQQRSVNTMKLFLAASHSPNPFDLKAALLAGHAQHPVIIHFPIALFIASAVFEVLAIWRKHRFLRRSPITISSAPR